MALFARERTGRGQAVDIGMLDSVTALLTYQAGIYFATGDAPARMLLLCTPAGFAEFVVEMSDPAPAPPDMAKLMTLAAKYSIDILGPLPEQTDAPAAQ